MRVTICLLILCAYREVDVPEHARENLALHLAKVFPSECGKRSSNNIYRSIVKNVCIYSLPQFNLRLHLSSLIIETSLSLGRELSLEDPQEFVLQEQEGL